MSDAGQDRLGRSGFADRLARTIADRGERSGAVVGLYGAWGDGKSTVLSFVAQYLGAHAADRVVLVHFNPWFDTGEAQIFAEFLHAVATAAGVDLLRAREKAAARIGKVEPFAQSVGVANSVLKHQEETQPPT